MAHPRARVAIRVFATTLLLLLSFGTGPPDRAVSQTAPSETPRTVFSNGGCPASAAGKQSVGTLAQPSPIGIATGRGLRLCSGFWAPGLRATDAPSAERPTTRLEQNVPNPFNPATRIDYSIAEDQFVLLEIYNLQGRKIRVLVAARLEAGAHHVIWNGRDDLGRQVASGVYFYRLQTEQHREVKRMLLLK